LSDGKKKCHILYSLLCIIIIIIIIIVIVIVIVIIVIMCISIAFVVLLNSCYLNQ